MRCNDCPYLCPLEHNTDCQLEQASISAGGQPQNIEMRGELAISYIIQPMVIETLGSLNQSASSFINEIDKSIFHFSKSV